MRRESASEREAWTREIEKREGTRPIPVPPHPLKSHGRLRVEKMNKTEAAYAAHLNLRKITGEVLWFQFEGITLKLANDTRYTGDFDVLLADLTLEIHEVKGTQWRVKQSGEEYPVPRFEDDARVKIEVAAAQFPITFKVVYRVDGNWIEGFVGSKAQ